MDLIHFLKERTQSCLDSEGSLDPGKDGVEYNQNILYGILKELVKKIKRDYNNSQVRRECQASVHCSLSDVFKYFKWQRSASLVFPIMFTRAFSLNSVKI